MFLNNDTVVVGGESSTAAIHSLIEKKQMARWVCHDTRVRCMTLMSSADSSLLVTASSSDHKIKLWDVSQAHVSGHVECVGEVDTTCRVTSLAVWHPGMKRTGSKKKKRKEQEEVSEGSPKKKIKIDDANNSKESQVLETITVEEEINDAVSVKQKKKKKKSKPVT